MHYNLEVATDPWGVHVERVEIKDVRLPLQLQKFKVLLLTQQQLQTILLDYDKCTAEQPTQKGLNYQRF